MEYKNYLLVATGTTTGAFEKVNVLCDMQLAKSILHCIMKSSSRINLGEIFEGNRTHIGDFRVRPFYRVRIDKDGNSNEEIA